MTSSVDNPPHPLSPSGGGVGLVAALAAVAMAALAVRGGGSMAALTCWMHHLLAYSKQRPLPDGQTADAIVVLGYALHRNGTCTAPLKSRVQVGVQMWQQGAAPRLVFSGAHPGGGLRNVTEADAMWDFALTLVPEPPPPGSWLREDASTSTRTNALFSWQLLAPRGWRRLLVVTNPFHQRRSYWTFARAAADLGEQGGRVFVAPAPCAGHAGYGLRLLDAAADQWDWWREVAAVAYYGARGWL